MGKRLLIATNNQGKVEELRGMFAGSSIEVVSLAAFGNIPEIEETGATFAENARLKAAGYALATGLPALADDSGLQVAALGGRPGVLSARYGSEVSSFAQKIEMLLAEVLASGSQDRSARFVCDITLASPNGEIVATKEGICDGLIIEKPRGSGGFGYDPIFMPLGYEKTFGELSSAIKSQISHRARAFSLIMPILRDYFGILT
ncbi:MAG TPA: RdgB/HAM1 family non-canonical purine NTP pyrophosphatase [Pyrinomonadaceae bacterium]|jgi:XTP/dITP diphosphohydrolase|nr:RdgB/HAM1 family non-canonical purine NTP pyrophosphatase [Pyrinomonadaceae bacterium]